MTTFAIVLLAIWALIIVTPATQYITKPKYDTRDFKFWVILIPGFGFPALAILTIIHGT